VVGGEPGISASMDIWRKIEIKKGEAISDINTKN
jgi:hypothetical protein